MNRKIGLLIATLLAALGASACGTFSSGTTSYPAPTSYTVSYMGTCYAGYMYDANEVATYGASIPATCVRMAFPPAPPLMGTPQWFLWDQIFLPYNNYWHSGYYYDQVLQPMSVHYHVTIVQKTAFMSNSATFDQRYSKQIQADAGKAKWSNGKTGPYTFPTSNTNAANKPLTNTQQQQANNSNSTSRNLGTDNSSSARTNNRGPLTNTAPKAPSAPKPAAPRSGRH